MTIAPRLTPAQHAKLVKDAQATCWKQGYLDYKFHDTQRKIRASLDNSTSRKFFLLCSRRTGKSYMLVCLAIEAAIKKPNARVLYLAPTMRDANDIASDLAVQILADCPPELKPEYKSQSKELHFPNGSIIRLRGCNNEHADSLRGGAADLIILDECGQVDNLSYVVTSVCLPMTLTTGGRILLASTPPTTPAHDSARIYAELLAEGSTSKFTLLDSPHISDDVKAEILKETGESLEDIPRILAGEVLPKTTSAQRELFSMFVVDSSMAVIPDMNKSKEHVVKEHVRPPYFFGYTSIDPASARDKTGILVGYHDFLNATLVIEEEDLLTKPGTDDIYKATKAAEHRAFSKYEPVSMKRSIDHDVKLIIDLTRLGLDNCHSAIKPDLEVSVMRLRHMIDSRKLIINPRCVNLIHQLETAIWASNGKDVAREGTGQMSGHFDLLAALRYMVHDVEQNKSKTPYPSNYFHHSPDGIKPFNVFVRPSEKKRLEERFADNTPMGRRLHAKKKGFKR